MSISCNFDSDYNTALMEGENELLRKAIKEIHKANEERAQSYFQLSKKLGSSGAFALYNKAAGLLEANFEIEHVLNKYRLGGIIDKE